MSGPYSASSRAPPSSSRPDRVRGPVSIAASPIRGPSAPRIPRVTAILCAMAAAVVTLAALVADPGRRAVTDVPDASRLSSAPRASASTPRSQCVTVSDHSNRLTADVIAWTAAAASCSASSAGSCSSAAAKRWASGRNSAIACRPIEQPPERFRVVLHAGLRPVAVVAQFLSRRAPLQPRADERLEGQPALQARATLVGPGRVRCGGIYLQAFLVVDDPVDVARHPGGDEAGPQIGYDVLRAALQHVAVAAPAAGAGDEQVPAAEILGVLRGGFQLVRAVYVLGGGERVLGHVQGKLPRLQRAHHVGVADDEPRVRRCRVAAEQPWAMAYPLRTTFRRHLAARFGCHAGLDARSAAAVAAEPVEVRVDRAAQRHHRQPCVGFFHLADVSDRCPVEAAGIQAVGVVTRPLARTVLMSDDVGDPVAVLVGAGVDERHRAAGKRCAHAVVLAGGVEHLRPDHVQVLHVHRSRRGALRLGDLLGAVGNRWSLDEYLDGVETPDVRREAAEEVGEEVDAHRGPHQVPRGVLWPGPVFRRRSLDEDRHVIAFLHHGGGKADEPRARTDPVVEQHVTVDAIRYLAQPVTGTFRGYGEDLPQPARHRLGRPPLCLALYPFADPLAGRDPGLQVGREDKRVADRVLEELEQIASQLPPLADPHGRHVQAFLPPRGSRRVEPARGGRTALALVPADLRPADQLLPYEDRGRDEHVQRVNPSGRGVVEEEDVAVTQAHRWVTGVVLHDVLDRAIVEQAVKEDAGGNDRGIAACGQDAAVHVAGDDAL